jgi:uncharacterized protein (TIGR02147 family)
MSLSVFNFDSYKAYMADFFDHLPKKGHGQFRKMAGYLNISPVVMTQVFRGERDLTLEQATELTEFLGLLPHEQDYFLLLVEHARAGSQKLKKILAKRIYESRQKTSDLKNRLPSDQELPEEIKARYFSDWSYAAVFLLTGTGGFQEPDQIAERLGLTKFRVREILNFMVENGLCTIKNSKYIRGPQNIHLEAGSPLIVRHHQNWRLRALRNMEKIEDDEIFFTGAFSLSEKDILKLRGEITTFIEKTTYSIRSSKDEKLACLNIDWFKF